MLELLAPAGDMEAFDVAVASGADAVYLGLDNFNARMKAQILIATISHRSFRALIFTA